MNISGNVRNTCNEASGMTCARREAGARRPAPPTSADSPRRPEPRPGRARARLFFFPALALLLGALSLFHAAPAAAQTTVTLSAPATVNEGSTFQVTVTLSANPSQTVNIPITVTRGSSEAADITGESALASVSVSSAVTSETLTTTQDLDAQDEKVTYSLGTLPTGYTAGTANSVTVTILDDETKPTVTFESAALTVTEGLSVNLNMTRTGGPADTVIPITVNLDSAETADLDSDNLVSLRQGFYFLNLSTTVSELVLGTNQDADAADEKLTVAIDTAKLAELGYQVGANSTVTVTILDDETKPTVTFTTSSLTVTEGSRVQLRATRSAAPGAVDIPLTVDLGTAETGDLDATHLAIYRSLRGLSFGTFSAAITVIIDTNRDLDTDDETFTLALDTAKLAELGYAAGTVTSVTVTIDDDGVTRTVSLSAAPNPVAEGSNVIVTATLSKAVDEDVTIPLTVTLDTAEDADFDTTDLASLRTGLTFAANALTADVVLATEQDADAIDETFTVALGALPSGVRAGSPASVAVTIQDDEFTGSRVTLWAPDKVDEGGRPFPVSATLSEPASSDVEIRFTGTLGTAELADFTAESQALFGAGLTATIPAGKYTAEIELATEHDDMDDGEDETFTVSIDTTGLPSGYGAGAKISHTVTIDDDDRLNPDPDLLTGLTLHDGLRELFFMPNRADDAVGLGGPSEIYTVQVSPGRRWIDVTAVWTNPAITSLTGRVRYHDSARSDGGTLTWSSSGEMERLDMQSPLGGPGHPLLTLTVNGARGQPYRFYFQHNFDWKNANDMLERLYLRFRSSQ